MKPTLVVFDIGGVLVRIRHSWNEILDAMGEAPIDGATPLRHADYGPLTAYQDGTLDEEAYLSHVGGDLGLPTERAREAHVAILETDYAGARQLVEDLRAAGVHTACLSNTNAMHWVALTNPGKHPAVAALDKRFASFEIRVNKPDPRSYRIVTESFPAVERKIFFDDNLGNVIAAINLGWEAHRIDPYGDPPAQMRRFLTESGVL
jgi:HAD superfamily hydrolase (TIGR01509 family)